MTDIEPTTRNALESLEKIQSFLQGGGAPLDPVGQIAQQAQQAKLAAAAAGIQTPPIIVPQTAGVGDGLQGQYAQLNAMQQAQLNYEEQRLAVKRELRKRDTSELMHMFGVQARQKNAGVPLELWMAQGGATRSAGLTVKAPS